MLGMFAGSAFILLAGAFYLGLVYVKDFYSAFVAGAAVFTVWMVVKVLAAASIYTGVSKKYKKLPE